MPLLMVSPRPSPSPRPAEDGTVLAFDFGLKRIGVAIGATLLRRASALTTIEAETNETRFAAIARLIQKWQPSLLVIGLPLALDGTEH